MIDQCLPAPGALRDDWLLWVELWLHAARRPELRPTAARLYARMHAWFARDDRRGRRERRVHGRATPTGPIDRLLALIDGYGIRALTDDPAMPIERARERDLGRSPRTWASRPDARGEAAARDVARRARP